MKSTLYKVVIISLFLSLTGCLYRPDIQQGNEITPELVSQLHQGMTKQRITELIGFPLISDPFHKERWDYFYSIKDGNTGEIEKHTLTLQFINERLSTVHSSFAQ